MTMCRITDCPNPVKGRGLCQGHLARERNGVEYVCQQCGREWQRPLAVAAPRKYCSEECVAAADAAKKDRHRAARRAKSSDPEFRAHQAARMNEWRRRNPDAWKAIARRRHLMGTYKITPEQYEALLERQGGHCAMCPATSADDAGRQLHVDHDHTCCPGDRSCGKCIRGLLCKRCNTMLGCADDDPQRLRAGLAYLARHAPAIDPHDHEEAHP